MPFLCRTSNTALGGVLRPARPATWSGTRGIRASPKTTRQFHPSPPRKRYPPPSDELPNYETSPSPSMVVGSIIALCTGVFGWVTIQQQEARKGAPQAQQNLQQFKKHMVVSPRNIREGRYYTLLTSSFAHVAPVHLVFNMVALWGFGRPIVARFGAPTFAVLWVGSAISCGLTQSYFWRKQGDGERGALGASGALLGILGVTTCIAPRMPMRLFFVPMTMLQSMLITVGVSVACIRNDWLPFIGHVGHLGGLAFGGFWYLVALRRGRFSYKRR